ncbi:MAG: hypothetical protein NTY93_03220 [Candidatus Kaiserbacteria bacterium]|nr:hypothetical protein [Candidatus Kaiserbacteria bacterium]
MRSRIFFFAFVFAAGSLALPSFAHAAIPFFGPIVPDAYNVCPASWGLLVTVINNIISLVITLAIVFIAPIVIAYAGFLLMTGQGNPGTITKAKGLVLQVVVGIVVMLAAWLIVDAVMAVLTTAVDNKTTFARNWSALITSGGIDPCIKQAGSLPTDELNQAEFSGVVVGTGGGRLTFNSGINAQVPNESAPLSTLLSCIGDKLTTNAVITSISDSKITSGTFTINQCAAGGQTIGCAHTANSCHYGGRNCVGSSYAVDLVGNAADITNVAKSCNASVLNEGNHLHVSVGLQNGCGCDAGLD